MPQERFLWSVLVFVVFAVNTGCADVSARQSSGDVHTGHKMTMHHQHQMLNHALGMAVQGSNLVMLGQMNMVPGIDEVSINHGNMMMKNARGLWNEAMSGEMMMAMHKAGKSPADDPVMKYTHELAETQLKVMDLLSQHAGMTAHTMSMHHQHIMLNHALKMALEGSDLIMTGQMSMAPGIDEKSISHGKSMMKNARGLWNEVMSGKFMMQRHKQGKTPQEHKGMAFTHKLAEAQLKVMNLLEKMPSGM
jgi:hypothetical protein